MRAPRPCRREARRRCGKPRGDRARRRRAPRRGRATTRCARSAAASRTVELVARRAPRRARGLPSPARPASMASSTRCGGRKAAESRERVLDVARGTCAPASVAASGAIDFAGTARSDAGRDRAPRTPRTASCAASPARRAAARAASQAPGAVGIARRGRVHLERLGRVALAPFDSPDALDELRGGRVKGHRARPRSFANGLGLDGLGEREHLRPRGERALGPRRARVPAEDRSTRVAANPASGERSGAGAPATRDRRREQRERLAARGTFA